MSSPGTIRARLRSLNRELDTALWERDYRLELGLDTGSKITMNPVDKQGRPIQRLNRRGELDERLRYIDHLGSVHFGLVEHGLIYDKDNTKRQVGDWMKKETVRLTKPLGDLFTKDATQKKVIVSESLQSPQNTAANNAKWARRIAQAKRQAKAYKAVTSPSQRSAGSIKVDTTGLDLANERSANDYRKYFR